MLRFQDWLSFDDVTDVVAVVQGHPERMSKVNPFARALIFTKSGFSGVFWDEK